MRSNKRRIKERRKVDDELLMFKLGIERSDESVFITNIDGSIIYVNPAFEKIYGYSREEALGKTPRILKSGLLPSEGYKQFWDTLLAKKVVKGELINKAKDGRLLNIGGSANPILNDEGNIIGFLAIQRDITEEKRAEELLRKNMSMLEKAQELGQMGSWEWDIAANELVWSDEVYKLYGLDPAKDHPDYDAVINTIAPEYRDVFLKAVDDSLKNGKPFDGEYCLFRPDGTRRYTHTKGEVIRDKEGNPVRMFGIVQDITARKLAEEDVWRSAEMSSTLLELSRLRGHSLNEITAYVLDACVSLTGSRVGFFHLYNEDKSEITLNTWSKDVVTDCSLDKDQHYPLEKAGIWADCIRLRKPVIFNDYQNEPCRKGYPNGHIPVRNFMSIPLFNKGKIVMVCGVGNKNSPYDKKDVDELTFFMSSAWMIMEEIRAEEELQKSEIMLRESQTVAHLGSYVLDIPAGIWTSSDVLDDIFGIDGQFTRTFEGWLSLIHPQWQQAMADYFTKEVIGKHIRFDKEYKIIRNDDAQERWVHGLGELEFDTQNKPVKMIGTIMDITERKLIEERLNLFYNLIERSNDAIFINDPDTGLILDANERACVNLGYGREELLNMRVFDFEVSLPEKFSWEEHVKEIKSKGHLILEGRNRRKDGTTFPVEVNVSFAVLGKTSYLVAIVRDITERKRTEAIERENDILVSANKAKSEFLANMSHELRTPLNSIIGFSELLKYNSNGELNKKQHQYVDNVLTSSKILLEIINDILDISKVEAGKIELVKEMLSAPDLINDTLILIKEKAFKNNIIIKKEIDPEFPVMEIDQLRFKQVLFNLLSNAIKFSKPEGGTVTIKAKKDGTFGIFSISDTGIGIKAEDMKRLFRDFEQLDAGISRKYGGTGLGLALSKKLIELQGGKIWVESKYGEGTTFFFNLPI